MTRHVLITEGVPDDQGRIFLPGSVQWFDDVIYVVTPHHQVALGRARDFRRDIATGEISVDIQMYDGLPETGNYSYSMTGVKSNHDRSIIEYGRLRSIDDMGMKQEPVMKIEDLPTIIESLVVSSLAARLDRERPYDGQPHTDEGERGKQLVEGLTMRDITDCFVRACYEASGLSMKEWPGTVYDLPWDQMDIMAISQNLTCQIEKQMGIYPNVLKLLPVDPTVPHWCGELLEKAIYQSHSGDCDRPRDVQVHST